MAILAYILFFIPLIAARDSRFAIYHANQGLILFITGIALGIALRIISYILFSLLPFAFWGLFTTLSSLLSLTILALAIIGIINAA
ncbi:MAG: zinc ribbon domain-containing protein, partial [Firmicutes bacterium]|nr:zinc ribbon domain-containing protein [Bacillota bacterium]